MGKQIKTKEKTMEHKEFKKNIYGSEQIWNLSSGPIEREYWSGYKRGMQRHYYGENCGTAEDHKQWMAFAEHSKTRHVLGLGYRVGFNGTAISYAIKILAKISAASQAGSVRSDAKTIACRANSKKPRSFAPRPNARGKKKPRKIKNPENKI